MQAARQSGRRLLCPFKRGGARADTDTVAAPGRPSPASRLLAALALLGLIACAQFCAPASASATGSHAALLWPLPSSDYTVRPACAPALPGAVSCQALELVPLAAQARAHLHPLGRPRAAPRAEPSPAEGDYGFTPADLHSAYRLPVDAPTTQTVALVDAYNDPAAEEDLAAFDQEFGLPACTVANGCLRQVNQRGEKTHLPFPQTRAELEAAGSGSRASEAEEASEWGVEISLDIETVHAVCENCRILLVEAQRPSGEDLEAAESSAEALGADEISNSWAGPEEGESEAAEQSSPFEHPGTVITASAGDSGYLSWDSQYPGSVEFPASSPHVIAVGGTRLSLSRTGAWSSESVWNGDGAGGGGCSTVFPAPSWQIALSDWSAVGCAGKRAVADVAADADPYSGVAVEDSTSSSCEYSYSGHVQHWCTIGGTSLASPLIAAVFALAGGSGGVEYPASTLYANASSSPGWLHDITQGSNGECSTAFNTSTGLSGCSSAKEGESCSELAVCVARTGYDGPTGLGSPDGIDAFQASAGGEGAGAGESEGGAGEGGGGEPESPETGAGAGEEGAGAPGGKETGSPGSSGGSGGSEEAAEVEDPETVVASPPAEASEGAGSSCSLSGLSLTSASALAARALDARLARIAFTFEASSASLVQVSLARRRGRGHAHWQKLQRARRLEVARGRNSKTLSLEGALPAGSYRLTLKPKHGASTSLVFNVR